mgnify:FL=1
MKLLTELCVFIDAPAQKSGMAAAVRARRVGIY